MKTLCRKCGTKLSTRNPFDLCFCHPEHPLYNPEDRQPLPLLGTNLMSYASSNDDCHGLHGMNSPHVRTRWNDEPCAETTVWPTR